MQKFSLLLILSTPNANLTGVLGFTLLKGLLLIAWLITRLIAWLTGK